MEKKYFKFIAVVFVSTMLLSLISFFVIFSILDVEVGEDFLFKTVFYVGFVTAVMVSVVGLFSFFVSVDETGIRVGFPAKKLRWKEIESIKAIAIPKIKSLNKIIVSGEGQLLEVKLFIFKDQKLLLMSLRSIYCGLVI